MTAMLSPIPSAHSDAKCCLCVCSLVVACRSSARQLWSIDLFSCSPEFQHFRVIWNGNHWRFGSHLWIRCTSIVNQLTSFPGRPKYQHFRELCNGNHLRFDRDSAKFSPDCNDSKCIAYIIYTYADQRHPVDRNDTLPWNASEYTGVIWKEYLTTSCSNTINSRLASSVKVSIPQNGY